MDIFDGARNRLAAASRAYDHAVEQSFVAKQGEPMKQNKLSAVVAALAAACIGCRCHRDRLRAAADAGGQWRSAALSG
jgi:hypothetical protein